MDYLNTGLILAFGGIIVFFMFRLYNMANKLNRRLDRFEILLFGELRTVDDDNYDKSSSYIKPEAESGVGGDLNPSSMFNMISLLGGLGSFGGFNRGGYSTKSSDENTGSIEHACDISDNNPVSKTSEPEHELKEDDKDDIMAEIESLNIEE